MKEHSPHGVDSFYFYFVPMPLMGTHGWQTQSRLDGAVVCIPHGGRSYAHRTQAAGDLGRLARSSLARQNKDLILMAYFKNLAGSFIDRQIAAARMAP